VSFTQKMMAMKTLSIAGAVALALTLLSCHREPFQDQGWATRPITEAFTFPARDENGQVIPEGVTFEASFLEKGRHAYMHYCYACHGVAGDGKGPAAPGYRPPPRDFRLGNFKFGAVRSGELPNDDDLIRIIKGGLHGTAMLEWDVSDGELAHIIQFIKTFPQIFCDPRQLGDAKSEECKTFTDEQIQEAGGVMKKNRWLDVYERGKKQGQPKPTGEPVVNAQDPWVGKTSDALERGAVLYHLQAQCANCHPAFLTRQGIYDASVKLDPKSPVISFRDGLYFGIVLEGTKNPYLVNLMPPDFTLHPLRSIRKGEELNDLYRLIASGVGGVMPAWIDGLKPEDIWALTHYVKSLMDLRLPENRDKLHQLRDELANQPPFVPPKLNREPKDVQVTVSKDGSITVDGQAMDQGKLGEHFGKLVAENDVSVVITADKETPDAKIVALIDALKAAGVAKFALNKGDKEEKEDGDTVDDQPGGQPPEPAPGGQPPAPAPAPEAPKAPAPPAPAPAPPP
jgi:biopolymer transport protein ExbD